MWTSADSYLEKLFAEEKRREGIVEKYENTDNEDIRTLVEYIKDLKKDVNEYYNKSEQYKRERNEYWNKYEEYQKIFKRVSSSYKYSVGKERYQRIIKLNIDIYNLKHISDELL